MHFNISILNTCNHCADIIVDWLTLGWNGLAVSDTVKHYSAVDDLVHDDGEAVHITFLSAN